MTYLLAMVFEDVFPLSKYSENKSIFLKVQKIVKILVEDVKVPRRVVFLIYAKMAEFVIRDGKMYVATVVKQHILGVIVKSSELHTVSMLLAHRYITNSSHRINPIQ